MTEKNDKTPWRVLFGFGFVFGLIVFLICAYLMIQDIGRSTSSTAAISYLFVPFWAFIFSIPAFVVGLCVGFVKANIKSSLPQRRIAAGISVVIAISITAFYGYEIVTGIVISEKVQKIQNESASELPRVLQDSKWGRNKFILGAVAQNPQATTEILHQIAQIQDPELHQAMGSFFFDVLGTNTKGLAVMRLVADHKNVSKESLELLANSSDDYVLGDVARNGKVSEATLRKIASKGGYLIEWGVSGNPSAPADLLTALAKSTNEYTRGNIASNPGTPASDLAMLGQDQISHVRSRVALNLSTPKEVLLKLTQDSDEQVRRLAADRLAAAK